MNKLTIFFTFLLGYFSSYIALANQQLLFTVNSPGAPPYIYFDEEQRHYVGIIPDLLEELINTQQLNMRFTSNSRQRSEEYIYQDKADFILLSENWLKEPEKTISTVAFLQHRSFIYKASAFEEDFELSKLKQSTTVCTREYFYYPELEAAFKDKKLIRVDSSNQKSMGKMLFKHRCDLLIMNEYIAISLMNQKAFEGKVLHRSKLPLSIVPLNIVMRKELVNEKKLLDNHIKKLQENGELEKILQRHLDKSIINKE